MTLRALVTGFEPFGGDSVNPSADLALGLNGTITASFQIVGRVLPVDYRASVEVLRDWLREIRPAVVICTGLAASAQRIRIERTAHNEDDSPFPDNAGEVRDSRRILNGPETLAATLPVNEIVRECVSRHIPAEISDDAGRYVCNHVFYSLLHELTQQTPKITAGFIHVPSSLPSQMLRDAIAIALNEVRRAIF